MKQFHQFSSFHTLFFIFTIVCNVNTSVADKTFVRLSGVILDDQGNSISNGKVQIWQADHQGLYEIMLNPDEMDPEFQYFGTATSDADGRYSFDTVRPGLYPQRPVGHFHFKIFVSGELKLTTQFYFADENPPYPPSLLMDLEADGQSGYFTTSKNFTVNMGSGGTAALTPSQPAGPYYPRVDFFDIGNNLIIDDSLVTEDNGELEPEPDSISVSSDSEDSESTNFEAFDPPSNDPQTSSVSSLILTPSFNVFASCSNFLIPFISVTCAGNLSTIQKRKVLNFFIFNPIFSFIFTFLLFLPF